MFFFYSTHIYPGLLAVQFKQNYFFPTEPKWGVKNAALSEETEIAGGEEEEQLQEPWGLEDVL